MNVPGATVERWRIFNNGYGRIAMLAQDATVEGRVVASLSPLSLSLHEGSSLHLHGHGG